MEKEKIRLDDSEKIVEIELNKAGDKIAISAHTPMLFDKFAAGYKNIYDLADSIKPRLEEIEKKYEGKDDFSSVMDMTLETSAVNVNFSKDAVKIVDGIFGEGTVMKYFKDISDRVPDFLPDAYCIIEFLEKIMPVVERVFNRNIERRKQESLDRMAKYQPQDHKRPQRKKSTSK